MRSFSIIAAAVTAFSFTSSAFAAPFVPTDVVTISSDYPVVNYNVSANQTHSAEGCIDIITELNVDIQIHIDALAELTTANATADNIKPILASMTYLVVEATVKIKVLTSCSDSAYDCAHALFAVISMIITALHSLLSACTKTEILLEVIVDAKLGSCLCELITAMHAIIPRLLSELATLIHGHKLEGVIISLHLESILKLFV